MNTSKSSPDLSVPELIIEIIADYLQGNVDPNRDKMIRGWSEEKKKEVLGIVKKICKNKK